MSTDNKCFCQEIRKKKNRKKNALSRAMIINVEKVVKLQIIVMIIISQV